MIQKMSFKSLKDETSLKLFQEETALRINVKLPLEYLQRSKVVALMSKDRQTIVGGFVIANKGELRSFKQLPQDFIENNPYVKRRANRCFEVNGFWLNRHEAPPLARFQIYMHCFAQILKNAARGKYYFVYAFDASNRPLEKFFSSFNSTRIFHGEVAALEGMDGTSIEKVEICSLKRILIAAVKNPQFLLKRVNLRPWRMRVYE